jgi:hypothetical protein
METDGGSSPSASSNFGSRSDSAAVSDLIDAARQQLSPVAWWAQFSAGSGGDVVDRGHVESRSPDPVCLLVTSPYHVERLWGAGCKAGVMAISKRDVT